MYKILEKKDLNENTVYMLVEAPMVARNCLPGQFVIVRSYEDSERIPLTICDFDRNAGTVTLVFQTIGAGTLEMKELKEGEAFHDVVGPLGQPSEFCHEELSALKEKHIVFIAGGLGTAPVYCQVKWLHEQGVDADVILGARTKELIIMEEEMSKVAGNLYITTDDGSCGTKGFTTTLLPELLQQGDYDLVIACGPEIMMQGIARIAHEYNIPCQVSLEKRMGCGLGACLSCSIDTTSGERKKVCKDGPVFWAEEVFDLA